MERTNAQWSHKYWTTTGQLTANVTDTTEQVMDKNRAKRKLNIWETHTYRSCDGQNGYLNCPVIRTPWTHISSGSSRYMYSRYTVLILKSSVLSCEPSLHIRYSSVSMSSLSVIVRCNVRHTFGSPVAYQVVVRSRVGSTDQKPDANRQVQDRERSSAEQNACSAHNNRTTSGCLWPVVSVPSFEHAQNFPTD